MVAWAARRPVLRPELLAVVLGSGLPGAAFAARIVEGARMDEEGRGAREERELDESWSGHLDEEMSAFLDSGFLTHAFLDAPERGADASSAVGGEPSSPDAGDGSPSGVGDKVRHDVALVPGKEEHAAPAEPQHEGAQRTHSNRSQGTPASLGRIAHPYDVESERRVRQASRKSLFTFPTSQEKVDAFKDMLNIELRRKWCPVPRPAELIAVVKPPPGTAPGEYVFTNLPHYGFAWVQVPPGTQAMRNLIVEYEVAHLNATRSLVGLQERRYAYKLFRGRASLPKHLAKRCCSLVHRWLWLDLLQAQLGRLPSQGCPPMRIAISLCDLTQARWFQQDIAGAFKAYLAQLSGHASCARTAADVAAQICSPQQRALVALRERLFLLARGEEGPGPEVELAEGYLALPEAWVREGVC